MNGLTRRASDRADRECFGCLLSSAIIACRYTLFDNLNLAIKTSGAAFDQRNIRSKAHFVDMSSSFQVIQCVEYDAKFSKPRNSEISIFNVGVVGDDFDVWIELLGDFLSNLPRC